ncbi:type III-A CRISPR-associated RAMP protein Csm3 [Calditrichota bacterium LG25]
MAENKAILSKKIFIRGEIQARTGLHIGGSSLGMSIGGADSVVIRDPISNEPYIPGSSLKGKMRSLLEKLEGQFHIKNGDYLPSKNVNHRIGRVFGVSADKDTESTPTRLIVRDAHLSNSDILAEAENTDMPFTEIKTEVTIDRLTSKANPRQIERVPAGALFKMEMVVNVYQDDDEEELLNTVFDALKLVQDDYLGGNGTRGYGKVRFTVRQLTYKDRAAYLENGTEKEMAFQIPAELMGE